MEINTNNLVVDMSLVVPNEYNPKISFRDNKENMEEFEKIKASIVVAGQILPVLVRELDGGKYEIINGYHRYEAMKELGYSTIEVKNLGKIDFDTAVSRALLTEDTKVPIDDLELAKLLKTVVTPEKPSEYWSEILPYTSEVIQSKVELVDFDFDSYDDGGDNLNGEEGGEDIFTFKVSNPEDVEVCNRALAIAGDDKNEAFLNLCKNAVVEEERAGNV